MIRSINRYTLDTDVQFYGGSLTPYSKGGYEFAKSCGRVPQFQGEQYYWAQDQNFLGRKCNESMVAAINDKIYKIAYRFHDEQSEPCIQIREKLYLFIVDALGTHNQLQEVGFDHKFFYWETQGGNVIMEMECFDTELILTSSSIRYAKKKSFLSRIFS